MMPVVDGTTRSSRHEQLPVETHSLGNVRRTVTDPAGYMAETIKALEVCGLRRRRTGPHGRARRVPTRGSVWRRR